ncbi:MAG: hypothetical protein JNJ54_26105 [Myxococcaceae bacterium]|nr:hypothetical protein [Myxococcaceae bacterium]
MRALVLLSSLMVACGPATVQLTSATYSFEGLRGREGTPSAVVTGSTLEVDVVLREVKLTIGGATRKFTLSQASTITTGCPTNFSSSPQETRSLDAPNLQLGELLIDAPLLRSDCPAGSRQIVLQQGPVGAMGAAPDCSAEVLCLAYRRR